MPVLRFHSEAHFLSKNAKPTIMYSDLIWNFDSKLTSRIGQEMVSFIQFICMCSHILIKPLQIMTTIARVLG
jgi:hypothetical protein